MSLEINAYRQGGINTELVFSVNSTNLHDSHILRSEIDRLVQRIKDVATQNLDHFRRAGNRKAFLIKAFAYNVIIDGTFGNGTEILDHIFSCTGERGIELSDIRDSFREIPAYQDD